MPQAQPPYFGHLTSRKGAQMNKRTVQYEFNPRKEWIGVFLKYLSRVLKLALLIIKLLKNLKDF